MQKIPTLFDRNWSGNRKVINQLDPRLLNKEIDWLHAICTEKFNGTNVALEVREGHPYAFWKRKNPNKEEKKSGVEPGYTLVVTDNPNDQYILQAFRNTDYSFIEALELSDGLYSAEALGPKIQGNPYQLEKHRLIFFSIPEMIEKYSFARFAFDTTPDFETLKTLLPNLHSCLNITVPIEGLVWHFPDKSMIKIKTVDFEY